MDAQGNVSSPINISQKHFSYHINFDARQILLQHKKFHLSLKIEKKKINIKSFSYEFWIVLAAQ